LLRRNYPLGDNLQVALGAFAHLPADARSACIAVLNIPSDPEQVVASYRAFAAPVVFVCHQGTLQWWKQEADRAKRIESVPNDRLEQFFQSHQDDFSPNAIYRAKTWGHFDEQYQLGFVDLGLMPLVEQESGEALGRLLERSVSQLKRTLGWTTKMLTPAKSEWLAKSVFWLLAAKMLRDKNVPEFAGADLQNADDVFRAVAQHYGTNSAIGIRNRRERDALAQAANTINRFSSLAHVSTESLAYIYENTLISRETRIELGTHSTPTYLVDYIVGKLRNWIEEIPVEQRSVFEPGCGHAGFLIAAMRLLRGLLPGTFGNGRKRQTYLRQRLHGCDMDAFALEIARLSLTLADVPNPDGWDFRQCDVFDNGAVEELAKRATILLGNPPFENFTKQQKAEYKKNGVALQHDNKSAEILRRTLPYLPPGAVFGFVVPQGLLHSRNAASLREIICTDFELSEICLLPDNVFNLSDAESAVIIGRKLEDKDASRHIISYRSVREPDVARFKVDYFVSGKRLLEQSRFTEKNDWDLHVPELDEVWNWCQSLPCLGDMAKIGQGLFFLGKQNLPGNAITFSNLRFRGAKRGFVHFGRGIGLHELPKSFWLNIDDSVIDRSVTGTKTGSCQILLNYGRVKRGPWRLKALLDRQGHAVTSRFITVRPRSGVVPLEYLWALCNSPIANAFAYSHLGKRDNLVGTVRKIPVPDATSTQLDSIADAARAYLEFVSPKAGSPKGQPDPEAAKRLMLRLDAEVLRLYDLPPRLERELLDYFDNYSRQGVPFDFDRYYPEDYEPCFPLHEYLSEAYQRSTAGYLRSHQPASVQLEILEAVQSAVEAFEE